MRRALLAISGALALAYGLACGAFTSDPNAVVVPDAGEAFDAGESEAGEPPVPEEALDSGAGSADATAATSQYGRAVLDDAPIAYWRMVFDDAGLVPNVIKNAPALTRTTADPATGFRSAQSPLANEPGDRAIELAGGALKSANAELYEFNGAKDFTVECWAKLNGDSNEPVPVLGKAAFTSLILVSGTNGYAIIFDPKANKPRGFYGNGGGSVELLPARTTTLGEWHHYAMVNAGTLVTLFVDGESFVSKTSSGRPTDKLGKPFIAGGINGISQRFNGSLDEVAIYDKALTDERVAAHFQAAR
jgi:hypothetical protein